MKTPEKDEFRDWLEKDTTQWFLISMLQMFDANTQITLSGRGETVDFYKGQQDVLRFLRNPEDLL